MPLRLAAEETIKNWPASLDCADQSDWWSDENQTSLAIWRRTHSGSCGFTVIRHSVVWQDWVLLTNSDFGDPKIDVGL